MAERKPTARSRMTNRSGSLLPPHLGGVDGRSTWVRRMHDLIHLHLSDLGGADAVSEAKKSIARRAATLEVELERMEHAFAQPNEGGMGPAARDKALDQYQRASNWLRRLLEALGLDRLDRQAKDVTPLATPSVPTPTTAAYPTL